MIERPLGSTTNHLQWKILFLQLVLKQGWESSQKLDVFFKKGFTKWRSHIFFVNGKLGSWVHYPKEIRNPTIDLILALSTLTSDSDTSSLSGYGTETSDSSTDTDIDTIVNEYR